MIVGLLQRTLRISKKKKKRENYKWVDIKQTVDNNSFKRIVASIAIKSLPMNYSAHQMHATISAILSSLERQKERKREKLFCLP